MQLIRRSLPVQYFAAKAAPHSPEAVNGAFTSRVAGSIAPCEASRAKPTQRVRSAAKGRSLHLDGAFFRKDVALWKYLPYTRRRAGWPGNPLMGGHAFRITIGMLLVARIMDNAAIQCSHH